MGAKTFYFWYQLKGNYFGDFFSSPMDGGNIFSKWLKLRGAHNILQSGAITGQPHAQDSHNAWGSSDGHHIGCDGMISHLCGSGYFCVPDKAAAYAAHDSCHSLD